MRIAFRVEVVQNDLRKKITNMIKASANRDFETAMLIWKVKINGSFLAFLGSWLLIMVSTLSIGMVVGGVAILCTGIAVRFFQWE